MAKSDQPTQEAEITAAEDIVGGDTARFSDTELRGISSFADAMKLAESRFGGVVDASEQIGSGFVMLTNKDHLIDTPFVILSVSFPQSDKIRNPETGAYTYFAAVMLVTESGERLVMTDGSHGIYNQLDDYCHRDNRFGGIFVRGGLRKSTYELPDGSGEGTTYYLNV